MDGSSWSAQTMHKSFLKSSWAFDSYSDPKLCSIWTDDEQYLASVDVFLHTHKIRRFKNSACSEWSL